MQPVPSFYRKRDAEVQEREMVSKVTQATGEKKSFCCP
jgi:hypothetical protein